MLLLITAIFFPNKTYYVNGGIFGNGLRNVTIQIDGTLRFNDDRNTWPKPNMPECMQFDDIEHVTFTSSGKGTLDGNGKKWWGYINYEEHGEDRPRLFVMHNAQWIVVENLLFLNSPYWTFWANDVSDVEIRHSDISARRSNAGECNDMRIYIV